MDKSEIRIPAPCPMKWDAMTPADKGRFCAQCKKTVHDLSRLSEREARALLRQPRNEELCVRFLYDKHGKLFFAGDRAPSAFVPAAFLHRAKRAAIATAAVVALEGCSFEPGASSLSAGPGGGHDPSSQEYESLTGGATYEPPPAFPGGDAGADGGRADAASADGGEADGAADAQSTHEGGAASDAGPDSAF